MIVPVLLIGLALIFAYIGSRKQLSRLQLVFVLVFFAIGVVSVLFQDLTMRAAAPVASVEPSSTTTICGQIPRNCSTTPRTTRASQ